MFSAVSVVAFVDMKTTGVFLATLGIVAVRGASIKHNRALPIKHFKDFVAFGDSYTSLAGAGGIPITFDGGSVWPEFVSQSTHATLHDFAVAGSLCSNVYEPGNSTRDLELEDQLPAWLATANATHLPPSTTVYSSWIGTNDLGATDGFLAANEPTGYNITSFIECNWDVMDVIYKNGGRYFVIMNTAPLQLTTLYAAIGEGGVGNNHYWKNKASSPNVR